MPTIIVNGKEIHFSDTALERDSSNPYAHAKHRFNSHRDKVTRAIHFACNDATNYETAGDVNLMKLTLPFLADTHRAATEGIARLEEMIDRLQDAIERKEGGLV